MWEDVGTLCEWTNQRVTRVAVLFDDRATSAVLSFLQNTKVGQIVTIPPRGDRRVGGEDAGEEGGRGDADEEGGRGDAGGEGGEEEAF